MKTSTISVFRRAGQRHTRKRRIFNLRGVRSDESSYYSSRTDQGGRTYSVVLPLRQTEQDIDQTMAALLRQRLGFSQRLQIVLAADKSDAASCEKCRGWALRFPHNILCIGAQGGDLSSIRNAGMAQATGDWVIFIQPGDIVDKDYFLSVDKALDAELKTENLHLVACLRSFFDKSASAAPHDKALPPPFQYGRRRVVFDDNCDDVQLSTAATLFNRRELSRTKLAFEGFQASVDTLYLVARYLLTSKAPEVLFVPEARYNEHRRDNNTALPDIGWGNPEKYASVLESVYLDLIERAFEYRSGLPRWLQQTIVYELAPHFRMLLNNHQNASWVPPHLWPRYFVSLQNILSRINPKIIACLELVDIEEAHRMAMLAVADETAERVSKIDLIAFDKAEDAVCVRYLYIGPRPDFRVRVGATEVVPIADKTRIHRFLHKTLLREYIGWFPWPGNGSLMFFIDGKPLGQDLKQRAKEPAIASLTSHGVNPKQLPMTVRAKRSFGRIPIYAHRFKNAWLLMDRDTQADDNAEHLYRYIKAQRPDINAWFVLRKTSDDWDRLEQEGFKLIAFGATAHKMALLYAKHLISSHLDSYITDYLPKRNYNDFIQWDFTFLRHGVAKHDQSEWLNSKSIRHIVTSAQAEYDSICADDTAYKFTTREVALTGLPRHDRLIRERPKVSNNVILVMPTWRKGLVGQPLEDHTNDRARNPEFVHSAFYSAWVNFLTSPDLVRMAEHHGYEVVFFPHANLKPYIEDFRAEHVKVVGHTDIDSIQDLFLQAAVLITDFSSVAFEMAYLERPVLHYQFDDEQIFGGRHGVQRGYFDDRRDGFGPVCTNLSELLWALDSVLRNHGRAEEPYLQRMTNFFAFRDGRCCERVFELIAGNNNKVS